MICRFSKCFHSSKEIEDGQGVKVGSAYYHADCFEVHKDIEAIRNLFIEQVNPNVVVGQLVRTINTIVFEKDVQSSYLLFGLKYYINHHIPLNYPGGLYYVIQNKDVKREWDRLKANDIKNEINKKIAVVDKGQSFEYKAPKMKGIMDILC